MPPFFFFFEAPDFRLFFGFALSYFYFYFILYEGDAAAFFSLCILFNPVFIVTLLQPVLDLGERCIRQETRCSKKQGINEEQGRTEQDRQTQKEREPKSRRAESKKLRSHYNFLISNFSSATKQTFYAKI